MLVRVSGYDQTRGIDCWRMLQIVWRLPKIAQKDLAWLAGLLEGEGCFSEQHYHHGGARWYVLPSIQLAMTDRDVVRRAGALLGGKQRSVRSYVPKPARYVPKPGKYKRKFVWRVNGQRAAYVMKLLLPWMGKRRARAISRTLANYERRTILGGAKGSSRKPPKTVRYRVSKTNHRDYHRSYSRRWRKRRKRI